jgi:hypothetical protein
MNYYLHSGLRALRADARDSIRHRSVCRYARPSPRAGKKPRRGKRARELNALAGRLRSRGKGCAPAAKECISASPRGNYARGAYVNRWPRVTRKV